MTELDSTTADLAAVFAGRNFPQDTVKVLFDDSINIEILNKRAEVEEALRTGDTEAEEAGNEALKILLKKRESQLFTVHITEVPEHLKDALLKRLLLDHPVKTNEFGQPLPDPEGDEATVIGQWALHIQKIVFPDGGEVLVGNEEASMIYRSAPKLAKSQISVAIHELTNKAAKGHEVAIQEIDFLSTASREG